MVSVLGQVDAEERVFGLAVDDPRMPCSTCGTESNSVVLTLFLDGFRHPVGSVDYLLLVGLVLKITGEAFEFVCAVIPERLALGEGGEDSDLVSSCLLAIIVVYLCSRFRLLFDAAFDPVCYLTELTRCCLGESLEVCCHCGSYGKFGALHLFEDVEIGSL